VHPGSRTIGRDLVTEEEEEEEEEGGGRRTPKWPVQVVMGSDTRKHDLDC
jgi:hypothetical protein